MDSSDTNKSIKFGGVDCITTNDPKETIEKVGGMQKVILDLQLRRRKPKGKQEEELFKQILEAEAKGYTIHLPLE